MNLPFICIACLMLWPSQPTETATQNWIELFNGRNLDGWTPKVVGFEAGDNHLDTFRVEDGVLRVVYDDYETFDGKFGHLFCKTPYSHYRLRLEYRFVGDQTPGGPGWAYRNSGVMIHGQAPESMGLDQDFPVSIEVQLLGGRESGERSTGNLCTPGTHVVMKDALHKRHCTNSSSKTYRGDQWVKAEIEVRGGEVIRHIIDGQVVLEYSHPQLDEGDAHARRLIEGDDLMLTGGTISLQAESHPVEFRRIRLLPLDPK